MSRPAGSNRDHAHTSRRKGSRQLLPAVRYEMVDLVQGGDNPGTRRMELVARRECYDFVGASDHRALDLRFLVVRCGDSDLRMECTYPEDAGVGADRAEGVDRDGANRHLLVFEQPSPNDNYFGPGMGRQRRRDRRGVRDDNAVPGRWNVPGNLEGGRSAVDDERTSRFD